MKRIVYSGNERCRVGIQNERILNHSVGNRYQGRDNERGRRVGEYVKVKESIDKRKYSQTQKSEALPRSLDCCRRRQRALSYRKPRNYCDDGTTSKYKASTREMRRWKTSTRYVLGKKIAEGHGRQMSGQAVVTSRGHRSGAKGVGRACIGRTKRVKRTGRANSMKINNMYVKVEVW